MKTQGELFVNIDGHRLAIVADGMGGHRAGDVASGMTLMQLKKHVGGIKGLQLPIKQKIG